MPQIFGQTLKRLLPPKGKGVIRKRGETSCLPSCVPAAHSREYAVMIWHMRRAEVVAQASFSCRCAAIHLLAPYGVAGVLLTVIRQMGGNRKVSLTFTRAARPEGNGVDWQEGENRRCSPSCPQCGRAGRVPARDARALSLPYLANTLTAQGHYLRSIFTPFCAALINASTSSLVLNGANDTRMALSVRALDRPSARSTPLCLPLEQADPLDT